MSLRLAAALFLLASGVARGAELNTITAVSLADEGGSLVLSVKGSKPPNFTTFSMADPPRFVIDLSEARFQGVPPDVVVQDGVVNVVKNLSYGSDASSIARVMIAFMVEVEPPAVSTAGETLVVKIAKPAGAGTGALVAGVQGASRAGDAKAAAADAARAEAARKAEEEAQAAARAEAERNAAVEAQAKAEAERRAREESEAAARAEAERKAAVEAQAKAETERRAREESEAAARAEAERVAQAERQARADAQAREAYERERQEALRAESQARADADARAAEERARAEEKAQAEARAAAEAAAKAQAEAEERARADEAARVAQASAAAASEPSPATPDAPPALAAAEAAEPEPAFSAAPADAAALGSPRAQLREIGFRQLPGASRVFVRTSVVPRFSIQDVGENVVRVELENTRVSRRNDTRFLDTSFFPSAVALVTPMRRGSSYVLDIKLRERVPYQQRIEGDMLAIDFERPAAAAPAASPAEPAPAGDLAPAALEGAPPAAEPAAAN